MSFFFLKSVNHLTASLHIFYMYFQIYVQENNIYYLKDIKSEDSLEITTDGEIDQIYNGIPDWLYEGKLW